MDGVDGVQVRDQIEVRPALLEGGGDLEMGEPVDLLGEVTGVRSENGRRVVTVEMQGRS